MGGSLKIGRLFGIELRLHYSWFIIFILLSVSLSWQIFPYYYPGWLPSVYWFIGIITSVLFFTSVLAHEFAHSLIAQRMGVPVKSITLFVFGGISQITKEAAKPGDEFKIAAAGPICSVTLAGLFFLISIAVRQVNIPASAMTFWLAQINLILAVFNLIPGFPLDGGRIFRSAIWRMSGNYQRSTRIATIVGRGVGYTFIGVGVVLMFVYNQWLNGIWLAFIGWFLETAAASSYQQSQWRNVLHELKAAQVMTTNFLTVATDAKIIDVIHQYIYQGGAEIFIVVDEGIFRGVLAIPNMRSLPQHDWQTATVKELMTPLEQVKTTDPDKDALTILMQMEEEGIAYLPVINEGRVIGLVTHDHLIKYIRSRLSLAIPFTK